MIYAAGTAILAVIFAAFYLLDRGLANTLEAVALCLLRTAERARKRRETVADQQAASLRKLLNGDWYEAAR